MPELTETELDQQIRSRLANLMDETPFGPTPSEIAGTGSASAARPVNRRLIATAAVGLMMVAGTFGLARSQQDNSSDIAAVPAPLTTSPDQEQTSSSAGTSIDGPQEVRPSYGNPVELDLPAGPDLWTSLVAVGDDLISATSFGSSDSYQLEIRRTDLNENTSEVVYSADLGGFVTDTASSGQRIMVLVSRHTSDQGPMVVESADGGGTWTQTEIDRVDGIQNAVVSVAMSPDDAVIAGNNGTWSRSVNDEWRYSSLGSGENFRSVVWDESEFVLASGIPDPDNASDSNNAYRNSADGTSWTDPYTVITGPEIRTSDGPGRLVANEASEVLSITQAQVWDGDEPTGGGTEIILLTNDGHHSIHLPQWSFLTVAAVPGGWITSATAIPTGEPALLFSIDGLLWTQVGTGAGTAVEAVATSGGVAMNTFGPDGANVWFFTTARAATPPPAQTVTPVDGLELLPSWFDPTTAPAIFSSETADAAEAFIEYFEQLQHPDVNVRSQLSLGTPIDREDGLVEIRWQWVETSTGTAYLRRTETGIDVVAAVDDNLSLVNVEPIGERVAGTLSAQTPNSTFIDIFDPDGNPIASAPFPDGFEGGGFGTAAGPGGANLEFDLAAPGGSVRIRAIGVGGLFTNVTEFAATTN